MYNPMSTYSIAAYDPDTNEFGVAVQSKFLAVGALVPWVQGGVGAIATQAKTNAQFGRRGLELLKKGYSAKEVLQRLLRADRSREYRQIGIVDTVGNVEAFTGKNCIKFAGHEKGIHYICQGNLLFGSIVLENMSKGFEEEKGDLADKLTAALKSGQEAGGERRGKQSAALLVKKMNTNMFGEIDTYIDLRVDDHLSPISELKRLLQIHRIEYALNHNEKYYKFKGETKYRLIQILRNIGAIDGILDNFQTINSIIEEYGIKIGFKENIFKGNLINGKFVERLVSNYYEYEYKRLK